MACTLELKPFVNFVPACAKLMLFRLLENLDHPSMAVCARLLRGVGVGEGVCLEGAEAVKAVVLVVADEAVSLPAAAAGPVLGAAGPVAAAGDEVAARVLGVVAEETGYPTELLDMDLDLEADLGIDTVKQAEVFATIREAYEIERDDSLKLRDYPTINHVVGFVRERAGIGEAAAATEPASAAAAIAPVGAWISCFSTSALRATWSAHGPS